MTPRRVPVFVPAQAACHACGREVADAVVLELWDGHCGPRCYHARGLPVLRGRGA